MWRIMVTIGNAVAALHIRILKPKTLAQAGHDADLFAQLYDMWRCISAYHQASFFLYTAR